MFAAANQPHFSLSIQGLTHDFKVLEFTGHEAISKPYRFELDLISEQPDLDIETYLHQPAFLAFAANGKGVHGIIHSIAQSEAGRRMTRYRITLVPQLAYLAHRTNQRIFQQLSVPKIVAQILEEHGIQGDTYRFQLGSDYPERDYCTQYDETDLHFVQRLCEEEGIHFHFEHTDDSHVLVFGDDQTCFPKLAPTGFEQGNGMVADQPVIKRFALRLETRPSRVTRRDYDFEKPRLLLESNANSTRMPDLEDYDYPGRFTARERGKHLAQRSLERHRSDYRLAAGESDQPLLTTGHFLALTGHSRDSWNDLWLLTGIEHEGKQPQVLEESITSDVNASDGFTQGYRNRFTATPWDVPYRPQLEHKKPKVLGSQTAVVTGPQGEEIHCDQYGRVKVQFHWDREGQADDKTSCWLRVSSSWAGDRYGGVAIPRVGMEVLISFLEADPDQPLVTGCLYHKEHQVPYDLPAHKTRSVFKTLSTPGGGGFNEIRIEDKKGEEQIFVHAQRDWDQNIQHDQKIRVGHERHDRVEANSYTELMTEEHHTTHADRKTEIKANDRLTVGATQHVKLGQGQFIEAGQEIHYYAGQKVVIDAGMELTAKGGGSFLKLDPSGVTLIGPGIKINSRGGAGTAGIRPSLSAQPPADSSPHIPGSVLAPNPQTKKFQNSGLDPAQEVSVAAGQITFDAEGHSDPASPYFSRVIHWPGNELSGVTIGRGYDMGQRDGREVYGHLTSAGVESDHAQRLAAGAGLRGTLAQNFVENNKYVIERITPAQEIHLFNQIYPDYVRRAEANYEHWTRESVDKVNWTDLDVKIKEVLVDFVYQGFTKGPRPMRAGMRNNVDELIHYIETTPAMAQYELGRGRANYLRGGQ